MNIVKEDTLVQNYEFLYKGKAYETSLLVVDDSIVSVENKEVEDLFLSLNALPDLVTYVHRNGEIEYFDDREELLLVLPSIVKNEENDVKLSKVISNGIVDNPACDPIMNGYYANLFLCDDHNYGGKVRHVLLSTANRDTVVNHLKPGYDMAKARHVDFAWAGWGRSNVPEITAFMKANCKLLFETVGALEKYLFEA